MIRSDETEEKINRYIHEVMDDQEKNLFEIEMDEDQSLKKDVIRLLRLKKIHNSSKDIWERKKEIKEQLSKIDFQIDARIKNESISLRTEMKREHVANEIDRDQKIRSTKIVSIKSKVFRHAASIAALVILAAAGYYFFSTNFYSNNNYKIASIETGSITGQLDSMFETRGVENNIYQLLQDGENDKFLGQAKAIFKTNKNDEKLNYALIHTLLNVGKIEEASEAFDQLPVQIKNENEFKYLYGYIELNSGENKKDNAKEIFQGLQQQLPPNHPLKLNTALILRKLEE